MNARILAKLILLAALVLLLSAAPVHAATFNAGSHSALASAITSANGNSVADTINITGSITLTADLPDITSDITFSGRNNTIRGADLHRAFNLTSPGITVVIRDLTLAEMLAAPSQTGGAIRIWTASGAAMTLTLNRVTVRDSSSSNRAGGGLACERANVTINDSVFYNNSGREGGGMSIEDNCAATVNRSAFYNNSATENGGGINSKLATGATGGITLNNSTVYGNSAGTSGGGVNILGVAIARLNHVTISGNSLTIQDQAVNQGGGLFVAGDSQVYLRNSIVYGNTAGDCYTNVSNASDRFRAHTGNIMGVTSATLLGETVDCGAGTGGRSGNPQLAASPTGSPPYYALSAGSPAIDAVACLTDAASRGNEDQRGHRRPAGSRCDIGAFEFGAQASRRGSGGSGSSGDGDAGDGEYSAPTLMPPVSTCLTLERVWVDGITQSTQCQRVSGAAIGNAELAAAAVDAVDVWGWAPSNMQFCFFKAGGAIKFIDTSPIPRTVHDLPACTQYGMTCADIDRVGMVILQPGDAPPACDAAPQSQSLSSCMVTTTAMLNLRAAPAGAKIGEVAYDVTLTALRRTVGWFLVDNLGQQGWIAAMYVQPQGDCD
jgi:hypothetical protein